VCAGRWDRIAAALPIPGVLPRRRSRPAEVTAARNYAGVHQRRLCRPGGAFTRSPDKHLPSGWRPCVWPGELKGFASVHDRHPCSALARHAPSGSTRWRRCRDLHVAMVISRKSCPDFRAKPDTKLPIPKDQISRPACGTIREARRFSGPKNDIQAAAKAVALVYQKLIARDQRMGRHSRSRPIREPRSAVAASGTRRKTRAPASAG